MISAKFSMKLYHLARLKYYKFKSVHFRNGFQYDLLIEIILVRHSVYNYAHYLTQQINLDKAH